MPRGKAETWARQLMTLTDGYAIAACRGKLESGLARARLRAGLGLGLFGGTERRRKHSRLAKARCVNRLSNVNLITGSITAGCGL